MAILLDYITQKVVFRGRGLLYEKIAIRIEELHRQGGSVLINPREKWLCDD